MPARRVTLESFGVLADNLMQGYGTDGGGCSTLAEKRRITVTGGNAQAGGRVIKSNEKIDETGYLRAH